MDNLDFLGPHWTPNSGTPSPPLNPAKAFSRSGCGRIFLLLSGIMREGLSNAPAVRKVAALLSQPAGAEAGGPAQTRSVAMAMPCPTPMHMVESARRPPVRASCRAAVPVMRAPVMPRGWPRAIAPPLGFTRGSSSAMPSWRKVATPCAAKALAGPVLLPHLPGGGFGDLLC